MTGEIRNPAKLPTELYPAEKKFARCLAEGVPCIVGNGKRPRYEDRIESGEGANVVRGEVIRFFAYGGNKENPISGSMIHLCGACISESLDLTHVSIPYALRFDNCRFVASVVMQHTECAALYLNGSYLAQGLLADGLTTTGSVNLRNGFAAKGEVRLLGANIGGGVDCVHGKFYNPGKCALCADGLTTKSDVNLRGGFSAEGEVRLLNANIGGDLICAGGKFYNPGEYALSADGLTTKGSVYLGRNFFAKGKVLLVGANIGGNLDCEGGKFHNAADGDALNVEGGNISGGLLWRKMTCEGDVNFGYAKVDVLTDDSDSWKSCKVVLDGFTYDRFSNPMDAQSRIDWLAKRPDGIDFSPLPYEQAAKILFGMGHIGDAREILLKKERLQTADGKMPWLQSVGRRLWDVFAGYGYRLSYTAVWMAFFIAVGAVIFDAADARRRIVPAQVIAQADLEYGYAFKFHGARPTNVVSEIFPGYTEFTPLAYSLDVFIPFFILQQESAWLPDSGDSDNVWKPSIMLALAIFVLAIFAFLAEWIERECEGPRGRACAYVGILGVIFAIFCYFSNWLFGDWWWLTVWYWLEIIAGWILTSLFLLSVTGLLRPRQSSGEKD